MKIGRHVQHAIYGSGVFNYQRADGKYVVKFPCGWRHVNPSEVSQSKPPGPPVRRSKLTAKQEQHRANLGLTVEQYLDALGG